MKNGRIIEKEKRKKTNHQHLQSNIERTENHTAVDNQPTIIDGDEDDEANISHTQQTLCDLFCALHCVVNEIERTIYQQQQKNEKLKKKKEKKQTKR